jgi:hypothetical protein
MVLSLSFTFSTTTTTTRSQTLHPTQLRVPAHACPIPTNARTPGPILRSSFETMIVPSTKTSLPLTIAPSLPSAMAKAPFPMDLSVRPPTVTVNDDIAHVALNRRFDAWCVWFWVHLDCPALGRILAFGRVVPIDSRTQHHSSDRPHTRAPLLSLPAGHSSGKQWPVVLLLLRLSMLSSPRRSGQIGRWRNNTLGSQHCTRVVCVCVCVLFRRCVRKLVAVWTTENQIMRLLLGTGVTFGIFTPLLVATGIHHDT